MNLPEGSLGTVFFFRIFHIMQSGGNQLFWFEDNLKSICFQMLSLGHSIINGIVGNIFDENYTVEKECIFISKLALYFR